MATHQVRRHRSAVHIRQRLRLMSTPIYSIHRLHLLGRPFWSTWYGIQGVHRRRGAQHSPHSIKATHSRAARAWRLTSPHPTEDRPSHAFQAPVGLLRRIRRINRSWLYCDTPGTERFYIRWVNLAGIQLAFAGHTHERLTHTGRCGVDEIVEILLAGKRREEQRGEKVHGVVVCGISSIAGEISWQPGGVRGVLWTWVYARWHERRVQLVLWLLARWRAFWGTAVEEARVDKVLWACGWRWRRLGVRIGAVDVVGGVALAAALVEEHAVRTGEGLLEAIRVAVEVGLAASQQVGFVAGGTVAGVRLTVVSLSNKETNMLGVKSKNFTRF